MAAYAQESTFIPRRVVVFLVIVLFHILLVWALASGLARKVVETIAPPIVTDLIEEIQQDEAPPPPPPPEMERPPVEVPPPEVTINIPVESTSTAITDVTDRPVPMAPPPPPAPKPVNRVEAKIDGKRFPNSEDYYPASSKRLGEEGSPVVRVCVGPNGKLTGEPSIATSSGFPKLDEGAVKLAKAGRYIAGSADGQAAESCFSFRVKFEIKG